MKSFCLAVLLAGFIITSAWSGVVQPTQTSLYDLFPKQNQGENGIYLQYLSPNEGYVNLTNSGDYGFVTLGTPWNIPLIVRPGHFANSIHAHPSAYTQCGADRDAVIRIILDGGYGAVRLTGSAQTASDGEVRYYIYKGAENYSQPIWEQWNSGSFDLTLEYNDGDELFLAVDAGNHDINDWANWVDVRFQAVPEPTTLTFIGTGLGWLVLRIRRRS
jgi:hypothetical protein